MGGSSKRLRTDREQGCSKTSRRVCCTPIFRHRRSINSCNENFHAALTVTTELHNLYITSRTAAQTKFIESLSATTLRAEWISSMAELGSGIRARLTQLIENLYKRNSSRDAPRRCLESSVNVYVRSSHERKPVSDIVELAVAMQRTTRERANDSRIRNALADFQTWLSTRRLRDDDILVR